MTAPAGTTSRYSVVLSDTTPAATLGLDTVRVLRRRHRADRNGRGRGQRLRDRAAARTAPRTRRRHHGTLRARLAADDRCGRELDRRRVERVLGQRRRHRLRPLQRRRFRGKNLGPDVGVVHRACLWPQLHARRRRVRRRRQPLDPIDDHGLHERLRAEPAAAASPTTTAAAAAERRYHTDLHQHVLALQASRSGITRPTVCRCASSCCTRGTSFRSHLLVGAVQLGTGCVGDGTTATDIVLDIRGDGRTYGPGDDAIRVMNARPGASNLQVEGHADCGGRVGDAHQDGIQVRGGTNVYVPQLHDRQLRRWGLRPAREREARSSTRSRARIRGSRAASTSPATTRSSPTPRLDTSQVPCSGRAARTAPTRSASATPPPTRAWARRLSGQRHGLGSDLSDPGTETSTAGTPGSPPGDRVTPRKGRRLTRRPFRVQATNASSRSASLGQRPSRLGAELRERLQHDAAVLELPRPGDEAVDEDRRVHDPVLGDDARRRDAPEDPPCGRRARAPGCRSAARAGAGAGVSGSAAACVQVVEHPPLLVSERPQREPGERLGYRCQTRNSGPLADVLLRRRAVRAQVAADEVVEGIAGRRRLLPSPFPAAAA